MSVQIARGQLSLDDYKGCLGAPKKGITIVTYYVASNNQVEYEAQLAGMKLASELGAQVLMAKSDSQLATFFERFTLIHVPREQNEQANLLSKLVNTQKRKLSRSVIQETLSLPTIEGTNVYCVAHTSTWMDSIIYYLQRDVTLTGPEEARKLRREASKYGTHIGGRASPARYRILLVDTQRGLHAASANGSRTYTRCHLSHYIGAVGQVKFLIVVINYFTKWVEAKSMATISAKRIRKFYWKKLICCFNLPSIIVLDNNTQFASCSVVELCSTPTDKQLSRVGKQSGAQMLKEVVKRG
ncbi:hypothetical protein CR513_39386, partial [Mucuna pruriens]